MQEFTEFIEPENCIRKTNRNVRLPDDLHGAVKAAAAAKSITLEKAYEQALRAWLAAGTRPSESTRTLPLEGLAENQKSLIILVNSLNAAAESIETAQREARGLYAPPISKKASPGISPVEDPFPAKVKAVLGNESDSGRSSGGVQGPARKPAKRKPTGSD